MKITDGSAYLNEIRGLIIEYTNSLERDLSFQHLTEELNDLEHSYTGENGRLLAALSDEGNVVGCVALRRHTADRCEMKRLYVTAYRHLNLGRQLIEKIIKLAREDGYREMVLDTIRPLKSAIRLYEAFGFREIGAYYENPMDDVIYMGLAL
ncbi:GNAT family N-acetyltransferase [Anaerolentibacter hominis]|uniref:GNAT family N-acetyltransferase n=1 Tax=Anaerolentibacter hominis TaxID=3079009 RepID=UPI0031B892E6